MASRFLIVTLAVAVGLMSGCRKTETEKAQPNGDSPLPATTVVTQGIQLELIGQVHWQGTRKLRSQTNATDLMKIVRLPETARLKDQTLDKLSRAPWTLKGQPADTNMAQLLRPLLDDALAEESYFVVSRSEDRMPFFTWAIQLTDAQARTWETNVVSFFKRFVNARPSAGKPGAWVFNIEENKPAILEITHTNGWTILGIAPQPNPVLVTLANSFGLNPASPVVWTSNYWFEIQVDPKRWPLHTNLQLAFELPQAELSVMGEGKDLRVDVELNFSEPLNLNLEPWKVPSELIDAGLSSFTAARGAVQLFERFSGSHDSGDVPNQLFIWGLKGLQMQSFFAAPHTNTAKIAEKITQYVMSNDPWGGTNELAGFQRSADGLVWKGVPYMWPFFRPTQANGYDYLHGGLFPQGEVFAVSDEVLAVLKSADLLYYDWEIGSIRTDQWIYISQYFRAVSGRPQLEPNNASLGWLKAIAPHLQACVTQGSKTAPTQISAVRRSTVGLTGVELQLICDWLESPSFPRGLHTFSQVDKSTP
jgi:hypothetical protein